MSHTQRPLIVRAARLMLASLLVMAGCGSGDASPDAGSPDDYPGCHWDCFGGQECENGQVRVWERGAIPCSEWTGDCPSEIEHVCEKGCRSDLDGQDDDLPPEYLCEEFRPKLVGDACASDSDCEPFTALDGADGPIVLVHLSCDLAAGQCVEVAPPVVEGVGDSCNVVPDDVAEFYGRYGIFLIDALDCATGLCTVEGIHDGICVPQSCANRCITDRDCPQGTLCWAVNDKTSAPQGGDEPTACVEAFFVDGGTLLEFLECPAENGSMP